jgi:ABC-2 type transport system permease protein
MTAAPEAVATRAPATAGWLQRRGPGWLVVAGKEFGEGLTSLRFLVLLGLLALAAAGPVYAASGAIRDAAEQASGAVAVFLAMFTIGADPVPSFVALVGFLAPLLGIAFGFDAINGERAQGTLPRLLSQPIHRDDVVNGKFAAGIGTIAVALVATMLLVAGIGLLRLGIAPSLAELLRQLVRLVLTIVYVSVWLAFATLCSVLYRRAAT